MNKRGQFENYSALYTPGTEGKTVYDLYRAIQADVSLDMAQRGQLLQQVQAATAGVSAETPLAILMARGLGGVLGWLVSKYFGMGGVGQVVSALVGSSLGKAVFNQMSAPANPTPGWARIGRI